MNPLVLVAVVAGFALLTGKKRGPGAGPSGGTVTFPPQGSPNLEELFCSPFDEYGGWRESSKVAKASELYVAKWGFDPTTAFVDAVKRRNPCERRHIDELVNAFPPFPGQTFYASELADRAARQAQAREAAKQAALAERGRCISKAATAGEVVGGIGGAVAGGVVSGGALAVGGAGAGAKAGGGFGALLGDFFC